MPGPGQQPDDAPRPSGPGAGTPPAAGPDEPTEEVLAQVDAIQAGRHAAHTLAQWEAQAALSRSTRAVVATRPLETFTRVGELLRAVLATAASDALWARSLVAQATALPAPATDALIEEATAAVHLAARPLARLGRVAFGLEWPQFRALLTRDARSYPPDDLAVDVDVQLDALQAAWESVA